MVEIGKDSFNGRGLLGLRVALINIAYSSFGVGGWITSLHVFRVFHALTFSLCLSICSVNCIQAKLFTSSSSLRLFVPIHKLLPVSLVIMYDNNN